MPLDLNTTVEEYMARPVKRGRPVKIEATATVIDTKEIQTTKEKFINWSSPAMQRVVGGLAAKGFTNKEISEILGITESGLCHQQKRHPEIEESLLKGRSQATQNVVAATYKRAMGYTYKEDHVTKDGDIIQIRKHMPGNPQIQMYWLNNRDPENWQTIKGQLNTDNGIGIESNEPEQDKITKLFGKLFKANTCGSVIECGFQDESAFASGQELRSKTAVCSDVPGVSTDSVQDDVLDVSAQKGTE